MQNLSAIRPARRFGGHSRKTHGGVAPTPSTLHWRVLRRHMGRQGYCVRLSAALKDAHHCTTVTLPSAYLHKIVSQVTEDRVCGQIRELVTSRHTHRHWPCHVIYKDTGHVTSHTHTHRYWSRHVTHRHRSHYVTVVTHRHSSSHVTHRHWQRDLTQTPATFITLRLQSRHVTNRQTAAHICQR